VHPTVDGGVGADTDTDREDWDDGESPVSGKAPNGIAHVLTEDAHGLPGSDFGKPKSVLDA
jgi:hypothetical protein